MEILNDHSMSLSSFSFQLYSSHVYKITYNIFLNIHTYGILWTLCTIIIVGHLSDAQPECAPCPCEKQHTCHINFEESRYQPIYQIASNLEILVLSKFS
jgi:hypothetical protein